MPTQRIVRSPRPAAVNFARIHVEPFTANAALLHLSPQQVAAYTQAVQLAEESLAEVNAAKQAWKAAAALAAARLRELNRVMTETVTLIDIAAGNAADPTELYQAAQLTPPNAPGVMPAPGVCNGFRAVLNPDGSLTILWKCKNPGSIGGVVYEVKRSLGSPEGPFTYLGVVGTRKFTDDTLPAGSASVFYQITGVRSTQRGPSEVFLVQFGVGGGGFAISTMSTTSGKLAA